MKIIFNTNLILLAFVLSLSVNALSQVEYKQFDIKRHTFYVEAFGQGLGSSANYDCLFRINKRIKSSFTIGVVYIPRFVQFGDGTHYGLPVSYNYLVGKKNHHLETGIGITILAVTNFESAPNSNPDYYYTYFTSKIGYRFQKPSGGLFFRFTLTPMFSFINYHPYRNWNSDTQYFQNVAGFGYKAFPWFGISVGFTIKK